MAERTLSVQAVTLVRRFSGLALMALVGCSSGNGKPPQQVSAAQPKTEVFVQSIDTVSTLEATEEIELAAQAAGRVQRVLVRAGDRVEPQQLLLVLDQAQLKADVTALKAQSEADRLAYQRLEGLVRQGAATALQRDEFRAKAVGSRHALRARQRSAIQRCAASDTACRHRAKRQVDPERLRGETRGAQNHMS